MHQAVRDKFMEFTEKYEGGAIDYMFLDILGRIGTAYGIDLDFNGGGRSPSLDISRRQGLPKALSLEWVLRGTTRRASDAEITREWETVEAMRPAMAYTSYYRPTSLQLTEGSMKKRVMGLLEANQSTLKQNVAFKNFENWPADAQLAVLGLSWNGVGHIVGNTHGTLQNPQAFREACQARISIWPLRTAR